MIQNLIHIKDIINNKEFIYNTQYNLDSGFLKCYESILKNDLNIKENIKYAIYENYCEIFYDEEIIKRGWVWNSTNLRKNIIYILRYIPIYEMSKKIIFDNKTVETFIETKDCGTTMIENESVDTDTEDSKDTEDTRDTDTDTDTEDIQDTNTEDSEDTEDGDALNQTVEIDILDELTIPFMESIKWDYNELEPVIETFKNLNLGNGYANNPFFPRELDIELKEKLSKPKFGLKSIV